MPRRVPSPATKGAELIEKLNSIVLDAEVDDLALWRIEQEARGLMAADPGEAHTVLGAVAALEGRTDDVRTHFRIAVQQSGNSADVYRNYSIALMSLGELIEALETAKQAFRRAPDDRSVLEHLISAALESGHFREARTLRDQFDRLSPERPLPDESLAVMLGDAVEREVFREKSVQKLLQVVHEILKSEGIRRIGQSTLMADVSYPDSFLYGIHIFTSPARAAELNETLANRLAAQPDLMVDPGTKFVLMFIGARVDGGHTERAV